MSSKKLKIAVIGSTGSVGKTSLKVISQYPKKFKVELLAFDKNLSSIQNQIKLFLPKYVYVNNLRVFKLLKKKKFKKKIIFVNGFKNLISLKKKLIFDKVILAAPGFEGLDFSFLFVNLSKELLIANKESIVCGGKILTNKAKKNNCKISSIDSEHYCLGQFLDKNIDKIYLTASGGPFLGKIKKKYTHASIKEVIKHPQWSMGKKISVDSATLVNKIFELIEAHVLFDIPVNKLKIKIHKQSLVHAAIVFKNGLTNLVMHDTKMDIPIRNSLFDNTFFSYKANSFNLPSNISLDFNETDLFQFEIIKTGYRILKQGHRSWILFNVINDVLVNKFLNKKIFFYEISKNLIKIFNTISVISYGKKQIKNVDDITKTINYAKKITEKIQCLKN